MLTTMNTQPLSYEPRSNEDGGGYNICLGPLRIGYVVKERARGKPYWVAWLWEPDLLLHSFRGYYETRDVAATDLREAWRLS